MPLFAAALAGPAATAGVGLLTGVLAFALGLVQEDQAGAGVAAGSAPQLLRLGFIAASTLLAVAVAAHRLRRERRARDLAVVAEAAQQAVMEPLPPVVGGLGCARVYLSATSQAQIGGDLVEVLDTPHGVRALVGDVRGKGMDAVRLAGRVLGSFREVGHDLAALPDVAAALDRTVRRWADDEGFVTAVLVQVDTATGAVDVLSCGHPAPFVVAPGVAPAREVAVRASPPLGLLGEAPEVSRAHLRAEDRLVLVTDGLLEARRPRRFSRRAAGPFLAAEEALGRTLGSGPLPQGLERLVAEARRWTRGRLQDDLAVLAVQLRPEVPEPRGATAPTGAATAR